MVDDAERIGGVRERGVGLERRAGVPVRAVEVAAHHHFGRAVVHVHRDDGVFRDRLGHGIRHLLRRQEVHDHGHVVALEKPGTRAARAEHQVDVLAEDGEPCIARPGIEVGDFLIGHLDVELPGQRRRHDDQRQAIALACREGLRRGAGHLRVVIDHQFAAHGVEERLPWILVAALRKDVRGDEVPHRSVDGKNRAAVDRLGQGFEERVVEQRRDVARPRGGQVRATRQRRNEQDCADPQQQDEGFHLRLRSGPVSARRAFDRLLLGGLYTRAGSTAARIVQARKSPPKRAFFATWKGGLRHLHLVGLHALRALHGDEGDLLAFLQRLEAGALDCAEVDEQVVTAFRGDEAETLGIVEPFDCTALAIRHDT